jgi:PEP-CTERM motif-containing protein
MEIQPGKKSMKIHELAASLFFRFRLTRSLCLVAVMASALAVTNLPAKAVASSLSSSYTINFAESTRLLNALGTPNEQIVQKEESCDNPHARVRARNRPGVKISNSETSVGNLSSFTIEIKKTAYLFGTGDSPLDGFYDQYIRTSPYSDEGVDITGSSVSEDGRELTINFDGLAAGKSVIFRVDLDTNDDSIFPFPDFRNVLFGNSDGSGMRATTSATFLSEAGSAITPKTLLTKISELDQKQIVYWEGNVRPYSVIDPVIPQGGGGTTEIPEPTSAMLLLAGVVGAFAVWRKRQEGLGARSPEDGD